MPDTGDVACDNGVVQKCEHHRKSTDLSSQRSRKRELLRDCLPSLPKMGGTQLYPAASPNVIVFTGCLPLKYFSCRTSWQCILPHQKGKVLLPVLLEGSLKTHQAKRWSRKLLSNPPGLSVLFCFSSQITQKPMHFVDSISETLIARTAVNSSQLCWATCLHLP